jgi:hypothetical protein
VLRNGSARGARMLRNARRGRVPHVRRPRSVASDCLTLGCGVVRGTTQQSNQRCFTGSKDYAREKLRQQVLVVRRRLPIEDDCERRRRVVQRRRGEKKSFAILGHSPEGVGSWDLEQGFRRTNGHSAIGAQAD